MEHPVLAIVTPNGLTLVIGRTQAQLAMTPTMMRWKAIKLLEYAEEAERQNKEASGSEQNR
jgi:hypothetical protein